jgi:hypothetical protein
MGLRKAKGGRRYRRKKYGVGLGSCGQMFYQFPIGGL